MRARATRDRGSGEVVMQSVLGGFALAVARRRAVLGAATLVALAATPARSASGVDMEPDAAKVVGHLEDAMGGAEHWADVRYLRFDWAVERDGAEAARARHLWDRHRNRYRVEWRTREGQAMLALFDVGTRAGRVWVDGVEASGDDAKKQLERAYGRFVNDTYWLLMPWKLRDPGVHVAMAGEHPADGKMYDMLHVHFDQVGLTPGDQYWAFVDRQSGLMDRWAYFLEGDHKEKGEPSLEKATAWMWSDWQKVGGVMLSRDRRMVGGEGARRIHFPVLDTPAQIDERVFTDPAVPMPG
jgi:hypothetical protein